MNQSFADSTFTNQNDSRSHQATTFFGNPQKLKTDKIPRQYQEQVKA